MRKIISLVACALVLTLSGCASTKTVAPKAVKSITLMPVPTPDTLFTQNKGLPVLPALIAYNIANHHKSAAFVAKYDDYRKTMGTKLTLAVTRELIAQGFKVQQATATESVRDKDGEIDYKKLTAHDAVMELAYEEVGMYSGRLTQHYMPMMNTYMTVVRPSNKEYLMDEKYYYGARANKDESWSIPSDPKFNFASFGDLMDQPNAVLECYDEGIQKMAKQLAKDFSTKLAQAH